MTTQELLEYIKDAIQRDEVLQTNMDLESIEEWDSLAIVSIISLYDSLFNIVVTGDSIRECKKVQDVINLAKDYIKD